MFGDGVVELGTVGGVEDGMVESVILSDSVVSLPNVT
jgi:hypothetical protein